MGGERPVDQDSMNNVDLDTVLVEIGQFGLYQFRTIALAAIVVIFIGWANTQYIFTTGRISTRCLIKECEGTEHKEFSPSWISNAVPIKDGSSDNCRRYAGATTNVSDTLGNCSALRFDKSNEVECDEYVYENNNTVAYDYDLACQEWKRTLIGSVRTFGTLVSHPITGYMSDRWGRRTAMTINAFNAAWVGVLRYWADTYIGFTISQFAEAALGFGGFSCAYIMAMELVGPKFRVAAAASISTSFAIGQVTLALIAWELPNWRHLTLAIYIPQFLTIIYFWIMSESARWYISKGLYEQSEKVLKDVARVNGKELSEKSLLSLRTTEEARKRMALEVKNKTEPWLVTLVFKHKPILIRCLVAPVWWITAMCVYYGLSNNAVNMLGNQYLNFMAVAAVEIPGFWTAVLFTNKIGRKPTIIGAFWVCAACMIGYIVIPSGQYGASLTVYLIGKCSISTVMTSIYVYTAELYPTKYRHSLFAFASMMGRIGSIAAPLTPALGTAVWVHLPFVIFAILAFVSGLLVFLTPETLGSKLPDTIEEATDIGNNKNKPI